MRWFGGIWSSSFWIWLLSAIVLWGAACTSAGPTPVAVVPGPLSLLAETLPHWNAPVLGIPGIDAWGLWPSWLYAALAAWGICRLVQIEGEFEPSAEQVAAVLGLSALVRPIDLFPLLLCEVASRPQFRRSPALSITIAVLGLLTTLEFGWLWSVQVMFWWSPQGDSPERCRRLLLVLTGLCVLIAGAGWLAPGWGQALLRPWNWLWLRPADELLSYLTPTGLHMGALLAFAAVLPSLFLAWKRIRESERSTTLLLIASGFYCLLAITCRYYAALGLIASLAIVRQKYAGRVHIPQLRTLAIAAAGIAVLVNSHQNSLLARWLGDTTAISLRPTDWATSGPVILLDLSESQQWRTTTDSRQYPLLADDRWDILGGSPYEMYAQLCRDLREVRDFSYLRSDGTWGGYKQTIREWHPSLVVARSADVDAIRGLSLSPEWRIMGVDSRQSIFGFADDPRHIPQMKKTLNGLMTLEWPAQTEAFDPENAIVSGTDKNDPDLALALCSLRFPYAGLRYLRFDDDSPAQRVKARCYLDLAHRVAGQSSTGSLFDQYRAIVLSRRILAKGTVSPEQKIRFERGVDSLLSRTMIAPATEPTPEWKLRESLLSGNESAARTLLSQVGAPLQSLANAILDAPDQTPAAVQESLQQVVHEFPPECPAPLRSEALFYLGCAALEVGDPLTAAASFHESETLDMKSPFREIRGLYLRQLVQ